MAIQKHRYADGDTEAWLKLRNSMMDKVGGSEIGIIAGHSQYNSPFAFFCQKTGAVRKPILKKREPIIQGHDGEDGVATRFEREMGKRVHKENCIMTNDAYPHLKASVDRMIYGEKSGLECKTAKDMAMKKYKNGDFPMSYFDQCLLYLAVTQMERWYLAIQVFGTAFRMFMMTTVRDEAERYQELKAKFFDWEQFKSRHYLEWTWNDSEKRFVYEGDDDNPEKSVLDIPQNIVPFVESADLTEWETKWCKLEAVYFVDAEEFSAAESLAATFCDRVAQVKSAMDEWKPTGPIADDETVVADAKKSALLVAVNAVWPKDEIDGSESTAEVIGELSPDVVVDSVVTCDEQDEMMQLVLKRNELQMQIDELKGAVTEIENKVALAVGSVETVKMPGWKITYKMSPVRESASAAKVKEYFVGKGMTIPEGLITQSVPKRSLRFWEQRAKSKR